MNLFRQAFTGLVRDKNWARVSAYWFFLSLLCFTIPIVIGHYFRILEQAAREPNSDKLPDLGSSLKHWKIGLGKLIRLAIPCLLTVALCAGALWLGEYLTFAPAGRKQFSEPQFIALSTSLALVFALAFLAPALILQGHRSPAWSDALDFGETLHIALSGGASYLPLGFFVPLVWLGLAMLAMTGIGVLLVPPLTVFLALVHARWLGLYERKYLLD